MSRFNTLTEEDKIKVRSIQKKKGKKRINVYFNRKGGDTPTYCSGKHKSPKCSTIMQYRSSYELRHFYNLDEDVKVIKYFSEAIEVPYKDIDGKNRKYIPDIVVVLSSGEIEIHEIKPKEMLKDINVQIKAQACREFAKNSFNKKVIYKFITQEDLFNSPKEYREFVNYCKKLERGKKKNG